MPRMKWGADFDELPDDWDDDGFEPYDGPIPPSNTLLDGEVKKMWAATFSSGNEGLVVLFEAGGNRGEKAKYDGFSTFERIALTPNMAWKYGPLFEALGITKTDVERKTVVADEDDNIGTPITKIGPLKFPKACAIITKREKYEGEVQAKAGKFAAATKRATSSKSTSAKARSRRAVEEDEYEDDDDPPF